jgi:hypothetical protein
MKGSLARRRPEAEGPGEAETDNVALPSFATASLAQLGSVGSLPLVSPRFRNSIKAARSSSLCDFLADRGGPVEL